MDIDSYIRSPGDAMVIIFSTWTPVLCLPGADLRVEVVPRQRVGHIGAPFGAGSDDNQHDPRSKKASEAPKQATLPPALCSPAPWQRVSDCQANQGAPMRIHAQNKVLRLPKLQLFASERLPERFLIGGS